MTTSDSPNIDYSGSTISASPALWLIVVFFFWQATTAYKSVSLAFLGDIHFERIVVILLAISIVLESRLNSLRSPLVVLYLALFVWMFVCYVASPYKQYVNVEVWLSEYWKAALVFLMICTAIRGVDDIKFILLGATAVSLFYQMYSWFDFAYGGSYVYQQGVRRIIGTWSGGGLGSANAFGSLAAYSIPLTVLVFTVATRWTGRLIGLGGLGLCIASIIYSGTRGALLAGAAVLVLILGSRLPLLRMILAAAVIGLMSWILLPDALKSRYLDISLQGAQQGMTKDEAKSAKSAKGRVDGLVDGFRLALQRPIVGYGPGSSAVARFRVRELRAPLQLHNQIGQVVGELGFVGLGLWIALLWHAYRTAHRISVKDKASKDMTASADCLKALIFTLTLYGAVSHNLYQDYWIFFLALIAALERIASAPEPGAKWSPKKLSANVISTQP